MELTLSTGTSRFIALHLIVLHRYCAFKKGKVFGYLHPANLSALFSQQRFLTFCLYHILVIHIISQTLS